MKDKVEAFTLGLRKKGLIRGKNPFNDCYHYELDYDLQERIAAWDIQPQAAKGKQIGDEIAVGSLGGQDQQALSTKHYL